ncbi:MAG: hypothetical protein IKF79_02235 [Methanosphaera sp.]|nr:hypothetical protein [Methanosphaera sp.]
MTNTLPLYVGNIIGFFGLNHQSFNNIVPYLFSVVVDATVTVDSRVILVVVALYSTNHISV